MGTRTIRALECLVGASVLFLAAGCGPAPELPVITTIDDLRVETSAGGLLTGADLDGSVWVADFIFTSCQMACPRMTDQMRRLAEEIDDPALRLLSISTDPATDTAEVLRAYAERFDADPARWVFGRVEQPELERLSEKEFFLGAADFPVGHSLKFVLIDRERRIRGYYDSDDPEEMETLRRAVERLL